MKHEITRADIMAMDDYGQQRKAERARVSRIKAQRRLQVGPDATFYFENYDTMWLQVHEMLFVEKGGEAQIADELEAYNPLIPDGHELVATLMFEIDDRARRQQVLARLGGVEHTARLRFAGETIEGVAEEDQARSTPDGKASSVQFIHFPFTEEQIARFRESGTEVIIGIHHDNYGHMAVMPEAMRAALAEDFD